MNWMSAKRRAKIHEDRPARREYLRTHPFCEARDAPGECFGPLTVHEIVPRARGGDTGDARLFKACCSEHNRRLSQNKETMEWGYENHFLFHSYQEFEVYHLTLLR